MGTYHLPKLFMEVTAEGGKIESLLHSRRLNKDVFKMEETFIFFIFFYFICHETII